MLDDFIHGLIAIWFNKEDETTVLRYIEDHSDLRWRCGQLPTQYSTIDDGGYIETMDNFLMVDSYRRMFHTARYRDNVDIVSVAEFIGADIEIGDLSEILS